MHPVIRKSEKEFPLPYPKEREPVYRPKINPNMAEQYKKRKG